MLRGIALASVLAIPALAQSDSSWSFSGSVSAELGYHSVVTQKNETGDIYYPMHFMNIGTPEALPWFVNT